VLSGKVSSGKRFGRTHEGWPSSTTWLFINHALCAKDSGRLVGYDNNHGDHHRHFAGAEEKLAFISYEKLLERFLNEVRELRQKKESI
jgi:hypothetical protein